MNKERRIDQNVTFVSGAMEPDGSITQNVRCIIVLQNVR